MGKGIGTTASVGSGVCTGHYPPQSVTVEFPSGVSTFMVDGMPALNMTCVGVASCGHSATPNSGQAGLLIEGSPAHCVGDTGDLSGGGTYTLTSGSVLFTVN